MYFDLNLNPVLKKNEKIKEKEVKASVILQRNKSNSAKKTSDQINTHPKGNKNNTYYNINSLSVAAPENYTYPEAELAKLQEKSFDYAFYLKKIQHKILISLKDSNFLIADRSMVIFKNQNIISQFISSKLDSKLIDNLIFNIKFHWSQDIKMISNLVIIKVISTFPEIICNLSEENTKYIQAINNQKAQSDDIWDIQFNLKAD